MIYFLHYHCSIGLLCRTLISLLAGLLKNISYLQIMIITPFTSKSLLNLVREKCRFCTIIFNLTRPFLFSFNYRMTLYCQSNCWTFTNISGKKQDRTHTLSINVRASTEWERLGVECWCSNPINGVISFSALVSVHLW